jgi:hypothetical protein
LDADEAEEEAPGQAAAEGTWESAESESIKSVQASGGMPAVGGAAVGAAAGRGGRRLQQFGVLPARGYLVLFRYVFGNFLNLIYLCKAPSKTMFTCSSPRTHTVEASS